MTGRVALITGITGQDGSYLAELLLSRGYDVHGIVRRLSVPNSHNIAGIRDRLVLHDGDLTDQTSIDEAVRSSRPDEVYNLGAQSFVGASFVQPILTLEVTGLGAVRLLEAVRRFADRARVYQASSSEMFGASPPPQNEDTPFAPRSPYGVAKVAAYDSAVLYRRAYGMFVSNGILMNHESPRRGTEFVTRKVSLWTASVAAGRRPVLELGNGSARRDWGWAPDYVDLMARTLAHDEPGDFVGATGETHTVAELVDTALGLIGRAIDVESARALVRFDTRAQIRPAEVPDLRGDASRAREKLGWKPTVGFAEIVRRMVAADFALVNGRPPLVAAGRPT